MISPTDEKSHINPVLKSMNISLKNYRNAINQLPKCDLEPCKVIPNHYNFFGYIQVIWPFQAFLNERVPIFLNVEW